MTSRSSYMYDRKLDWFSYIRYLFLAIPSFFWLAASFVSSEQTILFYFVVEKIAISFIIMFSAFAVRDGSRNYGLLGILAGFCVFVGSMLMPFLIPIGYLQEIEVLVAIQAMFILGFNLILLGTSSFAMWLSTTALARSKVTLKLVAFLIAVLSTITWIMMIVLPASISTPSSYPLGLPSDEIFIYMILIITSAFFVPRRQGVTILFFFLGLLVAVAGVNLYNIGSPSLTSELYPLTIFLGTAISVTMALPLGTSNTTDEQHPENRLYVILTLWYIIELLSVRTFPLTYGRVIAIAGIVAISASLIRPRRSYLSLIGVALGALFYYDGSITYLISRYFLFWVDINPFISLAMVVIGMGFLIYGLITFGSLIRLYFETTDSVNNYMRYVSALLILAGYGVVLVTGMLLIASPGFEIIAISVVVIGASLATHNQPDKSKSVFRFAIFFGFYLIFSGANIYVFDLAYIDALITTFYITLLTIIISGITWKAPESLAKTLLARKKEYRMKVKKPVGPEIEGSSISQVRPVHRSSSSESQKEDSQSSSQPKSVDSTESDADRMARTWYNRALKMLEVGELDEAMRSVEIALGWVPGHEASLELKKKMEDPSGKND